MLSASTTQLPPQPAHSAILDGQKALAVGVANDRSIAWGCAQAMHRAGAEIALTYLSDRARPHVEPLAPGAVRGDRGEMGPPRRPGAFDRLRAARGAHRPGHRPKRRCAIWRPSSDPRGFACTPSAPARRLVTIEEVGAACVFLASPYAAGDDRRHDLHRRRLSDPRLSIRARTGDRSRPLGFGARLSERRAGRCRLVPELATAGTSVSSRGRLLGVS
jgi:NAD(P)-dependent dehydrogenase (short-subunit alcohol dehydrogenase family)